ncbi:hypothetical protein [Streptomyces sp. NPDC049813]|uniref:hypothetical protein n=1 Tax=Streptomyces sp. NPDC049813 TaxID=3365597 RepID=UPI0037A51CF1
MVITCTSWSAIIAGVRALNVGRPAGAESGHGRTQAAGSRFPAGFRGERHRERHHGGRRLGVPQPRRVGGGP